MSTTRTRRLRLADLCVEIHFDDDFQDLAAIDRLCDFFCDEPPDRLLKVRLLPEGVKPFFPASGVKFPMFESEAGYPLRKFRLILLNPLSPSPHGFARLAFVNARERTLDLGRVFEPSVLLEALFNPFFLPLLLNLLLFDEGVLAIHANAVTVRGDAILLTGSSRSGKTTLTQLCEAHDDFDAITDDQALLRLRHGRWYVYASPRNWAFRRYALPRADDPRVGTPLSRVLFLGHGDTNSFPRLPGHRLHRGLLEQTTPRLYGPRRVDAYYDMLSSLCEQLVAERFLFVPDASAPIALLDHLRTVESRRDSR